jgi:hypothetical protein
MLKACPKVGMCLYIRRVYDFLGSFFSVLFKRKEQRISRLASPDINHLHLKKKEEEDKDK